MTTLPRTHRGYRWHPWELALFRAFKRDGAIPRQARPESYAIELDYQHNVRLWKRTRYASGHAWEQCIAAMSARDARNIPA